MSWLVHDCSTNCCRFPYPALKGGGSVGFGAWGQPPRAPGLESREISWATLGSTQTEVQEVNKSWWKYHVNTG
jgi:hypothetical protein